MKVNNKYWVLILVVAAMAILQTSCANVGRPGGGERDTTGPEVIGIIPAPRTLNYSGDQIDFYFDEYLKPGNYSKEIFISPIPESPPEISVKNKRLTVRFTEILRENTTYVITLSTEIIDYNEGNKMKDPLTFAFSTGDQLDSMRIKGKVENSWEGIPQKSMNVFLFPADEIEGNEITDQKPIYVTETDDNGNFEFEYLKEAIYKIYAVGDEDQSYSLNNSLEMIGLAEVPLVDLTDTSQVGREVEMFSFFRDGDAPKVRGLRWSNQTTMHLELSEPLREVYEGDSTQFFVSDTFGENKQPILVSRYKLKDKKHLFFHSPFPKSEFLDMSIVNLMDTLGNRVDTVVRLSPTKMMKEDNGKLFEKPIFEVKDERILLYSFFEVMADLDSSHIHLEDTSGKRIEMDIEPKGMEIQISLQEMPEEKMPYQLKIKPGFPMPGDSTIDTTLVFPMVFPSLDDYGTLTGKVLPDSTLPNAHWTVLIYASSGGGGRSKPGPTASKDDDDNNSPTPVGRGGRGGKTNSNKSSGSNNGGSGESGGPKELERLINPTDFRLYRYPAGSYKVKFIKDDDQNGYFTPGSLDPYRLPEKTAVDAEPIEIRAKWDVEGYNIFPSLKAPIPVSDNESKKR